MGNKFGLKALVIIFAIVMIASTAVVYSGTDVKKGVDEGGGKGVIWLVPPSFISPARAAGGGEGGAGGGGGAFPEDEAGISAYINTSQNISIEKLKKILTVVEEVGDNYIIGITPISDWGGDIDVHVYADTSGWIVAYIKNDEPASKIMQWGTADVNNPVVTTITTTTLIDALYKAGDAAGVGIVSGKIKYYDFEFPNANGMMLFIRTRATNGSNIHQVEIPATYTLYEASYYHYIYDYHYSGYYWDSKLKVDGTIVSDATLTSPGTSWTYQWWRAFDSYGARIVPGTLHKIEISYDQPSASILDYGSAGVATVLIYKTA